MKYFGKSFRLVVMGVPGIAMNDNRWKDDLVEDAERLGWAVTHLRARGSTTDQIEKACKGADMFLWSRSHGHYPTGNVGSMLSHIEDRGVPTVSHHMDLYFGVPGRESKIPTDSFFGSQWVFTADGGHQKEFAEKNVNHYWCPPAIGSHWLGRGVVNRNRYPGKYVFVGGFYRPAHGQHRLDMLNWARGAWGSNFREYGSRGHQIWGPGLNDLYTTAVVTLGDSAPSDYYWSDRVVHTLGRGGLLAHPNTVGMKEQGFTDEVMLLFDRGSFTSLGRSIRALTGSERRDMIDAAMTLVSERHTWKVRLLEIQRKVFEK